MEFIINLTLVLVEDIHLEVPHNRSLPQQMAQQGMDKDIRSHLSTAKHQPRH